MDTLFMWVVLSYFVSEVSTFEEWKLVPYIKDSISSTAYITSTTADTVSLCLFQCSEEVNCSMIGFAAPQRTCDMYNDLLTADLSFTFQESTTFYAIASFFLGMSCTAVDVAHATRTPDQASYSYSEAVWYACNDGYERTAGDPVMTCIAIDTWSGTEPVCTSMSCSALSVAGSTTTPEKASYAHSESVTYSCNTGFEHTSGELVRTCSAGTWSGSQPVCTGVTCRAVNAAGATKTPDKASYGYNEAVTYSCNPGFQRTFGDLVRRCAYMNTWSGSYPICTVVTCSALDVNGAIRSPVKSSYAYNEDVTYTCNSGFTYQSGSGNLVRTCTGINVWSGSAPVCTSVCSNSAYTYLEDFNICIRVSSSSAQWSPARASCQSDGADLIMVKDVALKMHLQTILPAARFWIGAYHTPGDPTDWHWVDGSLLSTDHHMWATNEPNNSNEECAEILFFAGVLAANNHLCDRSYKYICSIFAQ